MIAIDKEREKLISTLDLIKGPLIRTAVFSFYSSNNSNNTIAITDILLLVIHSLVIDKYSLRILVDDLENSFSAIRQDQRYYIFNKKEKKFI